MNPERGGQQKMTTGGTTLVVIGGAFVDLDGGLSSIAPQSPFP
jgi:hypothetical protein